MNKLFNEIASFAHDEPTDGGRGTSIHHLDIRDKICFSEILMFINREGNPVFARNLSKNTIPIKEAFKFAIGPKASKQFTKHEMVKKEFRKLVPALLLFTELYNIFVTADSNIDDDKIFPGEFMKARLLIGNVSGVTVNDVSIEEWEGEFKKIDYNKNGYITFNEFTKYCLSKVITPTFYINEITCKIDEEYEVIDAVGSQVVSTSILKSISSATEKSLSNFDNSQKVTSQADPSTQEKSGGKTGTISQLTRQLSSDCVAMAISKSVSNIESKKEDASTSPKSVTDADTNANATVDTTESRQDMVTRLTKQASSSCINMVISKSVTSVENARNSSLI